MRAELSPTARARPLSILLAGRAAPAQAAMAAMLAQAGHRATTTDDGDSMLDALETGAFDALVLMPTLPALQALATAKLYRFLSLDRPRLPMVAAVADATPQVQQRCAEAGVQACLTLPVERHRLLEVLRELATPAHAGAQAAPAEQAMAQRRGAPAIDARTLDALATLGGVEFADALVAQFLDETPALLQALAAAIHAGDLPTLDMQLYRLRNAAANVGARAIGDLCGAWDRLTVDAHARTPLERLRYEYKRVRGAWHGRQHARGLGETGVQPSRHAVHAD